MKLIKRVRTFFVLSSVLLLFSSLSENLVEAGQTPPGDPGPTPEQECLQQRNKDYLDCFGFILLCGDPVAPDPIECPDESIVDGAEQCGNLSDRCKDGADKRYNECIAAIQ